MSEHRKVTSRTFPKKGVTAKPRLVGDLFYASHIRDKFHKKSCSYAEQYFHKDRWEMFRTRQEALDSGRKPCRTCRS